MKIPISLFGLLARPLNLLFPVKKKQWVFSADYGQSYREGSKYMLEYMLSYHTDYRCSFITCNKAVYKELKDNGIPCRMNFSVSGILFIARSECVFSTQVCADLYFAYKKKNRRYFYLVHGMPIKKAINAISQSYYDSIFHKKHNLVHRVKDKIAAYLNTGYNLDDVEFISACSDFLVPFMQSDFGPKMKVKILGMPRNDGLFDKKKMENEKWIMGIKEKLIITYMPTHRGYGTGEVTPTPFQTRPDIQKWMEENNVILLMKNHPNMIPKTKESKDTPVVRDITKLGLDPQVVLYHSDVLITDFSSVWMDYLLLRRPILFYIYDDFEHNDAGVYYDIRKDFPDFFCRTEEELFTFIKQIKANYVSMIPSDKIIHKYHSYVDGYSCQRYFNEITLVSLNNR